MMFQIPISNVTSGVYILTRDNGGVAVYVGQSVRPMVRIDEHLRKGMKCTEGFIIPVDKEANKWGGYNNTDAIDGTEGAIIRALRPECNGRMRHTMPDGRLHMVGPKGKHSDDHYLYEAGLSALIDKVYIHNHN